jgi:hypothetical protein
MKSLYLPVLGGTFATLSACGRAVKQFPISKSARRRLAFALPILTLALFASLGAAPLYALGDNKPPAAVSPPGAAQHSAREALTADVRPLPPLHTRDEKGRPLPFVKLSQYAGEGGGSHYTDIAAGADGALHAV